MSDLLARLELAELAIKQAAHRCDGKAKEHLEFALAHVQEAYVAANEGDDLARDPAGIHSAVAEGLRMIAALFSSEARQEGGLSDE